MSSYDESSRPRYVLWRVALIQWYTQPDISRELHSATLISMTAVRVHVLLSPFPSSSGRAAPRFFLYSTGVRERFRRAA